MISPTGRVATHSPLPAFAALLVFSFALAGCTSNTSEDSTAIAVTVSDTECVVSAASASAGHTVFAVTNDGGRKIHLSQPRIEAAWESPSITGRQEHVPAQKDSLAVTRRPFENVHLRACWLSMF
jgi:hypothetical protein